MTETPSSIATHPPQHRFPASAPAITSPTLNGSLSDTVMQDETEDYTIKCICSYRDDDGSTVYCEKCETWQHIICYYQGKKVPDVHFCADCDPRQLDAKRATEHQKRLREHVENGERKTRRPPQKSHRKKKDPVATAELTNGFHSHARRESLSSARDQPPPAKRAKTSHRASTSIASLNGTTAPPESRKRATSSVTAYPSPAKSPSGQPLHPPIPMYSSEFLNLYENDKGKNKIDGGGKTYACSNSMSMAVTNDLTTWYDSPSALNQATGRQHDEVFHQSERPLLPHSWPQILLKDKRNPAVSYNGHCPKWKLVVLETEVKKDDFIGEIKGDIGRLEDYCLDPGSRWQELRHPEPFVFFHPQMPIYVDSRAEGTQFRYVRRSCHPNLSLKTFVTGERDFHHCFVAKEDIAAGTELTAMWYIDQTLFSNGRVKEENGDEEEPRRRATYFSRILSNFGACACESADCWLKNFDLRTPPETSKRRTDGRKGRGKTKTTASPSSTGRATNSRAGSENVQLTEEEDQADSPSTSDSIRSKPQSRDITPGNANQTDPADELSQRDKKKILMVERAFEEQQSKKQKPKRKRTSGGGATVSIVTSKNASVSASSLPATPNHASRPPDLNTASMPSTMSLPPRSAPLHTSSNLSPQKPSAPNTPSPLSQASRKAYVNHGVQTDRQPEKSEGPGESDATARRRYAKYEPPHIRRINMYQEWERRDTIKRAEMRKKIEAGLCSPFASIVPTWLEERRAAENRHAERHTNEARGREDMATIGSPISDVSHSMSQSTSPTEDSKSELSTCAIQLRPPPLPSQAAHTQYCRPLPHGPKLQLSTLPPVPAFGHPASSAAQGSIGLSPTPSTTSIPHSPFGNQVGSSHSYPGLSGGPVGPSPIKKKLSLGDYISRRSNLAIPVSEFPQAPATVMTAVAPVTATTQDAASSAQIQDSHRPPDASQATRRAKPDQAIKIEAVDTSETIDSHGARDRSSTPVPAAATITDAPGPSLSPSSAGPPVPVNVSSVLSNLEALAGGNSAQRAFGGPSS